MKRARYLVFGSYGLALASISLLFASLPAEAHVLPRAPIRWDASIDATIKPGDTQVFPVTLTAAYDLPELSVIVGPKIRAYATPSPATVGPLKRGQTVTINVSVTAPIDALPSSQDGFILLTIRVPSKHPISIPLPRPLAVGVDVVWQQAEFSGLGAGINYPPNWKPDVQSFRTSAGQSSLSRLTFDNGIELTEQDEVDSKSASSLVVDRLFGVNRLLIPIDQWFDAYFDRGFPNPLLSREIVSINGSAALRITTTELGGTHVHHYIADGADVIDISYGLFSPALTPIYESMTQTFHVDQ